MTNWPFSWGLLLVPGMDPPGVNTHSTGVQVQIGGAGGGK